MAARGEMTMCAEGCDCVDGLMAVCKQGCPGGVFPPGHLCFSECAEAEGRGVLEVLG